MNSIRNAFRLPLLAKELTERAARRRTYLLRVVYLLVLFGLFALVGARYLGIGLGVEQSLYMVMGAGRSLFEMLFALQLAGIYVFLPAMMCGAITSEKERDSLSILLLTQLSPWQIIWQKYLGGVVPMLTYLLTALPLAAVAYSYGGIEVEVIGWGAWVLLLTLLQVAALALMCSGRARTTGGAFIRTYIVGAALYFVPVLITTMIEEVEVYPARWWGWEYDVDDEWGLCFIPVAAVFGLARNSTEAKLLLSIPPLLSIAFCLVRARINLTKFAFRPSARRLRRLFRWLDGLFHRLNAKAGGVMLVKEKTDLPGDKSILWYESRQRVLSRPHYVFRLAMALLIPIMLLILYVLAMWSGGRPEPDLLSMWGGVLGGLAIVIVITQGAASFSSERTHQTLDVLLTTALSARDIVMEKMQALRRLTWVFMAAVLLLLLTARIIEVDSGWRGRSFSPMARVACSIATVVVYMALVRWMSMWIGLKVRGRFKATLITFVVFVVWCVAPVFIVEVVMPLVFGREWMMGGVQSGTYRVPDSQLLNISTPIYIPVMSEMHESLPRLAWRFQWATLLVNFGFYGGIAMWLKYLCLTRADRYLRG